MWLIGWVSVCTFMLLPTEIVAAASSRPSCTLSVIVDGVTTRVSDGDTVLLAPGALFEVVWTSKNATKATDTSGRVVALAGSATSTPDRDTRYSYRFSQGRASATCRVSVDTITARITAQKPSSTSSRPTIVGTAQGVSSVTLTLYPVGSTIAVYTSKTLRTRNRTWSQSVSKTLADGYYTISLTATKNGVRSVLATSSLTVGVPAAVVPVTTLVVLPVPLLVGGVARPGASVAVAYLQVINIGKATSTIQGFSLVQTGTTPVAAVVGLTAVSDNGMARGSIGTMITGTPFVASGVTVPVTVLLSPGEMRLFTIKAILAPVVTAYLGTTVALNVTGVLSNAVIQSVLPIRGTVWTIGS